MNKLQREIDLRIIKSVTYFRPKWYQEALDELAELSVKELDNDISEDEIIRLEELIDRVSPIERIEAIIFSVARLFYMPKVAIVGFRSLKRYSAEIE